MATPLQSYFQANPDVAAAYAANSYGLTPEQFAEAHYTTFGAAEGRVAPVQTTAQTQTATAPVEQLRGAEPPVTENRPSLVDQILATSDSTKWQGEGKGSARANAEDMASILSGIGVTDLRDFGQITQEVPYQIGLDENDSPIYGTQTVTTFGNTKTGQAVPNTYGERQTGDAFGGTYSGKGNTGYRVQFTPEGQPVFYTSEQSSSSLGEFMPLIQLGLAATGAGGLLGGALSSGLGLGLGQAGASALGGAAIGGLTSAATGGNVLQGALLGGAGGYLQGANAAAPGLGPQTDASFLAADAAQLAGQGLSESQIAATLGASGYGSSAAANLAASMAVNGLDTATMTTQLQNLSSNTGLMSQTGSSADFLAADALQLQGQVGNNFPAIEQNLIASGVDPLIAADVSQQLAFNPSLTQAQLATNLANSFGNNIYDVNMAQTYPTSVLPGSGGLLTDAAAAGNTAAIVTPPTPTPSASTGSPTGLTTNQISNLVRAGVGLLGAGGAASAIGGGAGSNTPFVAPTQQVPQNTPDYYNQLQQYYNAYLPQTPRDVVTPLQQWYNSSYGA